MTLFRLRSCTLWSLYRVHLFIPRECRVKAQARTVHAKARLLSVIFFRRPGGRSSRNSTCRCPKSVPSISAEMCSRYRNWPSFIIVSTSGLVDFVVMMKIGIEFFLKGLYCSVFDYRQVFLPRSLP